MVKSFLRGCAFFLALGLAINASAEYPDHPIRVIVPIDAGSTTDFIARTIAEQIRGPLGQQAIVENRSGAGGSIGSAVVARSAPDGYTLLVASSSHAVNPAIYPNLPYNTKADFAGISLLVTLPNVLVTSPAKNFRTPGALVDFGRAHPGVLNFGSGGVGSGAHMNAALFQSKAGFEAVHVAFKGTPDVVNALIAGRVDFAFVPITTCLPFLRSGQLVGLAVGASKRSALLPDLPTTEEAGVAGSAHNEWIGFFARAGTPPAVIRRLNEEVVKALRNPTVIERLASVGAAPAATTPEELDAFVKTSMAAFAKTVKLANIATN
jgi:tripartite-type tricarboxylate transporter receptor subunit TctC